MYALFHFFTPTQVAWVFVDPHAPPTNTAGDQLLFLCKGWASLSAEEQRAVFEREQGGEFGPCAPEAGWPSRRETLGDIRASSLTVSKRRSGRSLPATTTHQEPPTRRPQCRIIVLKNEPRFLAL